jgi:hypothetical protein
MRTIHSTTSRNSQLSEPERPRLLALPGAEVRRTPIMHPSEPADYQLWIDIHREPKALRLPEGPQALIQSRPQAEQNRRGPKFTGIMRFARNMPTLKAPAHWGNHSRQSEVCNWHISDRHMIQVIVRLVVPFNSMTYNGVRTPCPFWGSDRRPQLFAGDVIE